VRFAREKLAVTGPLCASERPQRVLGMGGLAERVILASNGL
jgi:hypothetical protein